MGLNGGGVDTVTNQYVKFKNDKFDISIRNNKKRKRKYF